MATVAENPTQAQPATAPAEVRIIDHRYHAPDCAYYGKWTWHTKNSDDFEVTEPDVATGGVTVYPVRDSSTHAFTWQQFRCVPEETRRYLNQLHAM